MSEVLTPETAVNGAPGRLTAPQRAYFLQAFLVVAAGGYDEGHADGRAEGYEEGREAAFARGEGEEL